MKEWVQNIETGEMWELDGDRNKIAYKDSDGNLQIDLKNISKVRFYPCDPKIAETQKELTSYGVYYQNSIFDYID